MIARGGGGGGVLNFCFDTWLTPQWKVSSRCGLHYSLRRVIKSQ